MKSDCPHITAAAPISPCKIKKKTERNERNLTSLMCPITRSEEHTSELQSRFDLVCRLLLEINSDTQDLHSFPTRRSSDLKINNVSKNTEANETSEIPK